MRVNALVIWSLFHYFSMCVCHAGIKHYSFFLLAFFQLLTHVIKVQRTFIEENLQFIYYSRGDNTSRNTCILVMTFDTNHKKDTNGKLQVTFSVCLLLKMNAGASLRSRQKHQPSSSFCSEKERRDTASSSLSHLRSRSTPIKSISPILRRCITRQSSTSSQASVHQQQQQHQTPGRESNIHCSQIRRKLREEGDSDEEYPIRPGTGSSLGDVISSPSSSPARVRRAAAKRMSSLWSSIKTSSPVRRAKNAFLSHRKSSGNYSSSIPKRNSGEDDKSIFRGAGRHSFSHPDVSCSNLATLAFPSSSSRDDMALLAMNKPTTSATTKSSIFEKQTSLAESIRGSEREVSEW